MSSTYAYVLNSRYSNTPVDMETTNWSCGGEVNNVYTVCYYAANVPPNTYVRFLVQPVGDNGLHVQPSPNGTPTGAWDLSSCQVTINTATGEVSIQPWGGPGSYAADAPDRPREAERRKPAKQGKKGTDPRTAGAGA